MNVADTVSFKNEAEGQYIRFESLDNARFPHYGIGIHDASGKSVGGYSCGNI